MSFQTTQVIVDSFAESLADAIDMMIGHRPVVVAALRPDPDASDPTPGLLVCWTQTFSLGSDATIAVSAPSPTWKPLGLRCLKSAGVDASLITAVRDAYCEAMQNAFAALARTLSEGTSNEITLAYGTETPPPEDAATASLTITFENDPLPPLRLHVSPAMETAVSGFAASSREQASDAGPAESLLRQVPDWADRPRNGRMGILMDVELPVTVSFGKTRLLVKEVIRLGTGSIVELNRSVSDLVELVVNNRVIARGEVVVVDGNYGLRVVEVLSQPEGSFSAGGCR